MALSCLAHSSGRPRILLARSALANSRRSESVFFATLGGYPTALAAFAEQPALFATSDQMVWPGVIERYIAVIEEAPFLSQQRRDILYNNAARFLRLSEEEIARHHADQPESRS